MDLSTSEVIHEILLGKIRNNGMQREDVYGAFLAKLIKEKQIFIFVVPQLYPNSGRITYGYELEIVRKIPIELILPGGEKYELINEGWGGIGCLDSYEDCIMRACEAIVELRWIHWSDLLQVARKVFLED